MVFVVFVNFDIAIHWEPFAVLFVTIVELQVFEPVFIRSAYCRNVVFTPSVLERRASSLEHCFLFLLSVRS